MNHDTQAGNGPWLDLTLESLEAVDTPLSNDFWTGVGIGAGIVLAGAGFVAAVVVAT